MHHQGEALTESYDLRDDKSLLTLGLLISALRLVQDPYANFVIQTALSVTSGPLHASLVEAIRPYLPSLRGTPFGKVNPFAGFQ